MSKKTLDYFIYKNLKERPYFFSFIRSQEAMLFEKYRRYCDKGILDFGCGDGFFAESIFGKQTIEIGLDVPSSRMSIAKKNNIYKKVISYDGMNIPLKLSSVDTIISNCVFEHIPHIDTSLAEMHRILKPGGHLITSVMCSSWNTNLAGGRLFGPRYIRWFNKIQEHNSLYSKAGWIKLFYKNGFDLVESEDYLYEKAAKKVEAYHFLSLYSLILYKITGNWTFGFTPPETEIKAIRKIIETDKKSPSACFFVLKKNKPQ